MRASSTRSGARRRRIRVRNLSEEQPATRKRLGHGLADRRLPRLRVLSIARAALCGEGRSGFLPERRLEAHRRQRGIHREEGDEAGRGDGLGGSAAGRARCGAALLVGVVAASHPHDVARCHQLVQHCRPMPSRTRAGNTWPSHAAAGRNTPSNWAMTCATPSVPSSAAAPAPAATSCRSNTRRTKALAGTACTAARALASERDRSRRNTSAATHSRSGAAASAPAGVPLPNRPRMTRPSSASRPRLSRMMAGPTPQRAAASLVEKGSRVRA